MATRRNIRVRMWWAVMALVMQSCLAPRESSKFGFNEGYYKSRIFHKKLKSVYVVPGEDSIKIYTRKQLQKKYFRYGTHRKAGVSGQSKTRSVYGLPVSPKHLRPQPAECAV